jgi:hypothetical protein
VGHTNSDLKEVRDTFEAIDSDLNGGISKMEL